MQVIGSTAGNHLDNQFWRPFQEIVVAEVRAATDFFANAQKGVRLDLIFQIKSDFLM
jgi:hypothetical protein